LKNWGWVLEKHIASEKNRDWQRCFLSVPVPAFRFPELFAPESILSLFSFGEKSVKAPHERLLRPQALFRGNDLAKITADDLAGLANPIAYSKKVGC
jgi:hypothetical protein